MELSWIWQATLIFIDGLLKPITGGYQNLVFEFDQNNNAYIFRVSDSITRSYEKYGFEYIGIGYNLWGESSRIYSSNL